MKTFKIMRAANGDRAVKVGSQMIPADIAGLCAGPDRWLAEIKCACRICKQDFTLRELHGGGQWCEHCQTAGME